MSDSTSSASLGGPPSRKVLVVAKQVVTNEVCELAVPSPAGEGALLTLLAVVLIITWIGVALAQFGKFSPANLAVGTLPLLVLAGWWLVRHGRFHRPAFGKEQAVVGVLCSIAVALYAQPTEHYPLLGDSAIYPNTGVLLARTSRLTYTFAPFESLTPEEKKLFYVPSDEQIPGMVVDGYQGLLFGAYYVTDADSNTIVSSRPAGFIVWTALAFALLGSSAVFWVTPIFGVMGVLALYLVGARLYGFRVGMLAALLLAVSFPQIHFARTPYAEAMAQTLVWGGLYCVIAYLAEPRLGYLVITAASFGAAMLTRIDALAILVPALVFAFVLMARRDARGAGLFLGCLTLATAGWSINATTWLAPYIVSSYQLFSRFVYGFLRYWQWLAAFGTGAAILLAAVLYGHGHYLSALGRRVAIYGRVRWAFAVIITSVVLYLYFVQPIWPPIPAGIPPNDILPRVGEYLSPVLIAAATLGFIMRIWHGVRAQDTIIFGFTLLFAGLFLPRYTSASVYPVALRRLVPEVIPALLLFASDFLAWFLMRPVWPRIFPRSIRVAQVATLAVIFAGPLGTSGQYLAYQESRGTVQFAQTLAGAFPADALIIFEPLGETSQVGWLACPLWSVYGRNAMLLAKPVGKSYLLESVLSKWVTQGKPVYYVTEQNSPPAAIQSLVFSLTNQSRWNSTIIGQSRDIFPPFIWHFDMPFYVYRLSAYLN